MLAEFDLICSFVVYIKQTLRWCMCEKKLRNISSNPRSKSLELYNTNIYYLYENEEECLIKKNASAYFYSHSLRVGRCSKISIAWKPIYLQRCTAKHFINWFFECLFFLVVHILLLFEFLSNCNNKYEHVFI